MKGKIDLKLLDERFLPYYFSGKRIVVDLPNVGERVGKVAVTGGPRPEFILLTNRTDHANTTHVLDARVTLVGEYRTPRECRDHRESVKRVCIRRAYRR